MRPSPSRRRHSGRSPDYATMYGPMIDDGFSLPAIPYQKIDPQFLRQIVPDPTGARPGTVVVDTTGHHLYLVRDGGMAIRYGVGLGRAGFEWSGDAVIQWKQHWPKWTPPDEMVARDPEARAVQRRQWRHAGRPQQSARRAGALSVPERRGHALPPARLAGMEFDRQVGVVGLRAADQPGHHRSLRSRAQPDAGDRDVRRRGAYSGVDIAPAGMPPLETGHDRPGRPTG